MAKHFQTTGNQLTAACRTFWHTYFQAMQALQLRQGRGLDSPIKDRNLGTTNARHVGVFEQFWRTQLASSLGVTASEVGPRQIRFRPHRSKRFDVCWPLQGEPKILISIKTMQSAYRNLTNRIEEAFGDSAVLRLYDLPCSFGFFFFMLDGRVPRGLAEKGNLRPDRIGSGEVRGVAPFLELIEEGGDFFRLDNVAKYRKQAIASSRRRQDAITLAEESLLDLVAKEPSLEPTVHYDAVALVPVKVRRLKAHPKTADEWSFATSSVDDRLDSRPFIRRLLDVAKLRRLI
ncbi:MAG: hypothetical protein WD847_00745 [Pirellulales bacterium]